MELINLLPAATYTCDRDGRITAYNAAAAVLWGRTPEIGKDLWCGSYKIYYTDGTPMLVESCPMATALREARPVYGEEIIVERPDGIRVNILPHPTPIYSSDGTMTGAINMLVDITDKKSKEHLLRQSESKYKALAETLEKKVEERAATIRKNEERYYKMVEEVQDYAILMLDPDGTVLNWNRGAEKIKGYTEKEIIGRNFRIFYLDEDRENKLPEQLINEAVTKGKAMHEGWRLRKDGTRFWGYIIITALHDPDGKITGFSKVTRDLTERKIAEDQLKLYAQSIEIKNQQLEEFAYVASHDLQEPLRKIQTFADMLERDIDDREAALKNIERIARSANRMSSLITDVLKYSQVVHADKLCEPTDLSEVMVNVTDDLDLLIGEKNATIKYPSLPKINAIPVQMHQLFFNLIGNAIKFNDRQPVIELTCQLMHGTKLRKLPLVDHKRRYFKITLTDNGIGFDQQYGDQIFKLFQRLDPQHKGTGIGLALCKRIIENHNGHIAVASTRGLGSTFTIYLPE